MAPHEYILPRAVRDSWQADRFFATRIASAERQTCLPGSITTVPLLHMASWLAHDGAGTVWARCVSVLVYQGQTRVSPRRSCRLRKARWVHRLLAKRQGSSPKSVLLQPSFSHGLWLPA